MKVTHTVELVADPGGNTTVDVSPIRKSAAETNNNVAFDAYVYYVHHP